MEGEGGLSYFPLCSLCPLWWGIERRPWLIFAEWNWLAVSHSFITMSLEQVLWWPFVLKRWRKWGTLRPELSFSGCIVTPPPSHFLVAFLCIYFFNVFTYLKNKTHHLDMCPDRKLNQRPCGAWEDTQPSDPHQLGLSSFLKQYRISEYCLFVWK